ncbi:MAG: transglutaminase-like putative cysteine protease [Gammaproteobacteria bacterium]|jgi:transglutaminase-like putative cysteine protease
MQVQNKQHLTVKNIPQEVANQASIFAVCVCFLFSITPHFFHLPLWVSGFVIVALGWRTLQNLGMIKALSKWIVVPLVLFGGVGVFAEYWTIVGRDAGLAFLTVMMSLKFLESRNHRDLLILIFLCYFLIATHFLYSQSILTAGLMLVTLLVITTTLVLINQRNDKLSIMIGVKVSARLILMSTPLMLILFILVPRIPGPLWGITNDQRGGITGLSDSLSPGKISQLIRSNEVAFRVSFKGAIPAQSQLYWRGPVMALFDGTRWSQSERNNIDHLNITVLDEPTEYTVTLEPNGKRWLLALDMPTQFIDDSQMTADYQLTAEKPINDLLRYTLQSNLRFQIGLDESEKYRQLTSLYPTNQNLKTIALGQSIARQYNKPEDIINHVLNLFRTESYFYTLSPPALSGDTVDQFLFETQRGFCEHYAGSFALLMRAAGIPSRIVAGYQGGEYNELGNYLIVRQSDAHAWTEVWIKNRGWIRVDPTAAVSPDRIELGLDEALPNEILSFRIQNRSPLFGNVLFRWDSIQNNWNNWVLNYDERKQSNFLQQLGVGIKNSSDMVFALVFMLLMVTGLYWIIGWYLTKPAKPARHEQDFNRLLKKLTKVGLEKRPAEDSRDFLNRIVVSKLVQTTEIEVIINLYNQIKYGPDHTSENTHKSDVRTLKLLINNFQTKQILPKR